MNTVDGGKYLECRYPISCILSFSMIYPTESGPASPGPTNPANMIGLLIGSFLISYTVSSRIFLVTGFLIFGVTNYLSAKTAQA
jgi:hypothetical protein